LWSASRPLRTEGAILQIAKDEAIKKFELAQGAIKTLAKSFKIVVQSN
jgi:hypothetical protein